MSGQPAWVIRLDRISQAEFRSLSQERDPEMYREGLLQLGRRLESENRLEDASQVYAELVIDPSPFRERVPEGRVRASFHEIQQRAQQRLHAITGTGSSAHRAEFLLRRLARESMEPTTLVGLTAASAAFRMTRLASLSRLLGSPTANFATRGFGARAAAGLLGFGVEATVFPLASRSAAAALGRDIDWSLHQVGREVAGSFLVLGALKLTGWGASALANRNGFLQQTGMLSGILLGHHLETAVGLRPHVDGATTFVDSLAMLVQFNVAGRLAHGVMGEGFRTWEMGLDHQARTLAETPHSITGRGHPMWRPSLGMIPATAGGHMGPPPQFGEGPRRGREGAPQRPTIMAMTAVSSVLAGEGVPPPPESGMVGFPPEARIAYPPEIDAVLSEVERIIRAPGYLNGSRRELLRKRPPANAIDRIWLHQNWDLFSVDGVDVQAHDVEILLEPLNPERPPPDPRTLQQALRLMGRRGRDGSLGREVLEIRVSREKLGEYLFGDPFRRESSITLFGTLSETQNLLHHRVHLVAEEGEIAVIRLTTLSCLEALLQAVHGRKAVQFHYVDGTISRDETMHLRSRKVSPVGMGRNLIFLGDINNFVFPSAFTNHDGSFHGAMDASARAANRAFAGRFYRWLGRSGAPPSTIENIRNRLSDGEFGNKSEFFQSTMGRDIILILQEAFRRSLGEASPYERRRRLRDLHSLADQLSALIKKPWEGMSHVTPKDRSAFTDFHRMRRKINQYYFTPHVHYPPEMRPVIADIERAKAQAGYMEGGREELLAKRVDINLADRLWFHQALDFAGHIPRLRVRELDAGLLAQAMPGREGVPDASLIQEALTSMDAHAPPGAAHRKVLEFRFPARLLDLEMNFLRNHPQFRYLATMPFARFLETHLDERVQLMGVNGKFARIRIPSLSLIERVTQIAHGEDRLQFHFVNGEIPRDDAMRLRAQSVSVVGLSASAHFFSEYEGLIHTFSFTGHDAFEHALREARLSPELRSFAGRLYFAAREVLPASRLKELFLTDIADLYSVDGDGPVEAAVRWVTSRMQNSLWSADRESGETRRQSMEAALDFGDRVLSFSERRFPELSDSKFRDPILELRATLVRKLAGESGE